MAQENRGNKTVPVLCSRHRFAWLLLLKCGIQKDWLLFIGAGTEGN